MKKIVFVGAYGIHSQGDDAALIFMVDGLQQRIGEFDGVILDRHASENNYACYSLRSIQNIEYQSKEESIGKWFYGFNYGDSQEHLHRIREEIESCDLMVIGAGNALVDITIDLLRGPIPYIAILMMMAKMYRKPVMLYGLSVGPFRTKYGRDLSRLIIELSDVLILRDEPSMLEVSNLGFDINNFMVLPDPVIGLQAPAVDVTKELLDIEQIPRDLSPFIAVSVRDIPTSSWMNTEGFVQTVADICDRLVMRTGGIIIFISGCTYEHGMPIEDDRYVAELVKSRMTRKQSAYVIRGFYSVHQTIALYRSADISLSTRLHANVFASIVGVPTIAISYNPKVAGFMRWLNREAFCVDLQKFNPTLVESLCLNVLSNKDYQKRTILSRIEHGRSQVESYIDIACDLITRSRDSK